MKPNDAVELDIEIEGENGALSGVDIMIDFGDKTERFFYAKLPYFGKVTHKYTRSGVFSIQVDAINFVSKLSRAVEAFVEMPVSDIRISATNTTLTSDPVVFTIKLPMSPVVVDINYGDEQTAKYTIGPRASTFELENHDGNLMEKKIRKDGMYVTIAHKYNRYTIYNALLEVRNNISKAEANTIVKVIQGAFRKSETIENLTLFVNLITKKYSYSS